MLVKAMSNGADTKAMLEGNPRLQRMIAGGQRAVLFDLVFPRKLSGKYELTSWKWIGREPNVAEQRTDKKSVK